MQKFESTGTVQNDPVPVRQRSASSVENIAATETSVEESPNVSLTCRFQALGISAPYNIKATQELTPLDQASYVSELGLAIT